MPMAGSQLVLNQYDLGRISHVRHVLPSFLRSSASFARFFIFSDFCILDFRIWRCASVWYGTVEALVGRNQNLNLTDNNGQNLSLATFVGELIESPCHKEYSTVPVVVHGFKTTGPKNNSKDTICDLQKARIDIIKIDKIDKYYGRFLSLHFHL